jgi:hypothetical protein
MLANKRAVAGSTGEPAAARFHSWTTDAVVDVGTRCELRARAAPAVVAAQFADGVEAVVHGRGTSRDAHAENGSYRIREGDALTTVDCIGNSVPSKGRQHFMKKSISSNDYLMMKLAF